MFWRSPTYEYQPLKKRKGGDAFRLLKILPNQSKTAKIECQLIDYFISDRSPESHQYEALSYVWGTSQNSKTIVLNGGAFQVTPNLHAALLELRGCTFERIVWIDAICINQNDLVERGEQIQSMIKIYGKARCVVLWLGESISGADEAIEVIGHMAPGDQIPEISKRSIDSIHQLLSRPWFRRTWVLQEVAAARQITILCGASEIDGHAFSEGLKRLNLPQEYSLRSRVLPVCSLISPANFRPRLSSWWTGRDSLAISSLAELIDKYHAHEATERHDMIFALLGMRSDITTREDLEEAGLQPNYNVSFAQIFTNLAPFLFRSLHVEIFGDGELAVVRGKGYVIGEILRVQQSLVGDVQEITISIHPEFDDSNINATPNMDSMREFLHVILSVSAKPILIGDLICRLEGQMHPMIIRPQKDFFSIIKIEARPFKAFKTRAPFDSQWGSRVPEVRTMLYTKDQWPKSVTTASVNRNDFLLAWDWIIDEDDLAEKRVYDDIVSKWCQISLDLLVKADRLSNAAMIMAECNNMIPADERIKEASDFCRSFAGVTHSSTLRCSYALGLMYKNLQKWDEAEETLLHVIQDTIDVQGHDDPDTERRTRSFCSLAMILEKDTKMLASAERIKAISEILRREKGSPVTEDDVVYFVDSLNARALLFLLDHRGHEFKITERIVESAAGNYEWAPSLIHILIDRRRDEINITERALESLAWSGGLKSELTERLLDTMGDELPITESVLTVAAERSDNEGLELLLRHRGDDFVITEGFLKSVAGHQDAGLMRLVLAMQNDCFITEDVLCQALSNFHAAMMVDALLDHQDDITITDETLEKAAVLSDSTVFRQLVDYRGGDFCVNPELLSKVAFSKKDSDKLLHYFFTQRNDEVVITETFLMQVANNVLFGGKLIRVILQFRPDLEISSEVMKAAVLNPNGIEIIQHLLDVTYAEAKQSRDTLLENPLFIEQIVQLLLRRREGWPGMYNYMDIQVDPQTGQFAWWRSMP